MSSSSLQDIRICIELDSVRTVISGFEGEGDIILRVKVSAGILVADKLGELTAYVGKGHLGILDIDPRLGRHFMTEDGHETPLLAEIKKLVSCYVAGYLKEDSFTWTKHELGASDANNKPDR